MADFPYSEFEALSKQLKTMPPFVFPAPGADEDEDEQLRDEWNDIGGTFPCPTLKAGTEFGFIEHSRRAVANAADAPDFKLVSMSSIPQDLTNAYRAAISEPDLDSDFVQDCPDEANLVLFALDSDKGGQEGVIGFIAANVSDLMVPFFNRSTTNGASMDLAVSFELVHVTEAYRGFGIGTTMGAELGYALGLSLKNLLSDHPSVLKSLGEINIDVTYESEFRAGDRVGTALCSGLSFMLDLEDTLMDIACENNESLMDIPSRTPTVNVEATNEF